MEQLAKQLLKELELLNSSSIDLISKCDEGILKCKNLIYQLKKEITTHAFKTVQEEVYFFKEIKSIPLSNVIYYSKLRSFLVKFPIGDIELQQSYTIKKMEKINKFMQYNHHFIQYVRQGRTQLDEHYFTRAYFDSKNMNYYSDYHRDSDFCTSHDLLFAKYKAYKRLTRFLQTRLNNLSECFAMC